ncbi:transmembrane protein 273 [Amblyraja radiata]|uniref:transmembrane protein 273 n=1 Tax=Amblyraja radiata TaxID=386614 RepID=UPI0014040ACC|nr:transmembrane protein 273 [Amblyraja radiata]
MLHDFSWIKILPTIILSLDYFTTKVSATGTDGDEVDLKYALMGAGIGIFLVVTFLVIKIYMIKKHIYENDLTDPLSKQSQSVREERYKLAQN